MSSDHLPEELFCVGLSHKTTDLSIREKIHLRPSALKSALERLRGDLSLTEAVILSTCNRFEVYAFNDRDEVRNWIARLSPDLSAGVSEKLETWEDKDSVRHLFSVASGLEAQVVGETQILGQVKDAYEAAREAGMTGGMLNPLFQRALAVGKRVRTETKLVESPVSVSSVAVRLCEKIYGGLAGRSVLIVGAGEISALAAEQLFERGARLTLFSTRSPESAQKLARVFGVSCHAMDQLPRHLPAADMVISGSGAPHQLISAEDIRQVQRLRKNRLLFLVDLAIPRDIDPAASGVENVFLYNLDDLDGIAQEHRREREQEIPKCERIVLEEAEEFWIRVTGSVEDLALHRFHSHLSDVVDQELRRAGLADETLEALKKSIPNRIMSEAFKRSRAAGPADRLTLLRALKEFFGL